jgi:hypothetical protein
MAVEPEALIAPAWRLCPQCETDSLIVFIEDVHDLEEYV